jgi:hypothetical protein
LEVGELASFPERSRQRAFERFELLRAHMADRLQRSLVKPSSLTERCSIG